MATTTLTERESRLYKQLLEAVENDTHEWNEVYIDNARDDFSVKELEGLLGSLSKKGLYRDANDKEDKGIWGQVKKEGAR